MSKHPKHLVLACLVLLLLSTLQSEGVLASTPIHKTTLATAASGPHREIFGFALASSLSDPTVGYPSWDFNLLSTVAFFGLHVQDDGILAGDNGMTVWNSSQLSTLVSTAHSHGTKVVLAVILQDFSTNTPHMCSGLSHTSTTVSAAVSEMKAKGVDGINLDYEGLNGSCGTSDASWARHAFTNLAASMRSAMPAGSYLSVDTYASSAMDPVGFFDIAGLGSSVDSFFVMAYDLEYSNWKRPPLNCGSFCLGPTGPLNGYYYNDTSTVNQYMSVVPASKVILGVPYYGRKACVGSAAPNQVAVGSVTADTYLDASTEATDPAVQPGSYAIHRDANDPSGQERWDTWFNTSLNCTRELYWDDVTSLGLKYDIANADNLRGVGMWNLNYGGGAPELWNALDLRFGSTTPWTALGGVIQGDPVVTSSGANRLDVFIRGSDNALWHRFWNGTAWSGWESLGGVLGSGPAAVAVSPNRLDVFIRGIEGGLWHRSWNSGVWSGWESLGGVINGTPSAVAAGTSGVNVFIRGSDDALWERSWNGTTWANWWSLGGVLSAAPNAAFTGAGRLDVFIRGSDSALWQRTWNGTTWANWRYLGGVLPAYPVAVVATTTRIDVFARGMDNAVWQNTSAGTGWVGWMSHGGVLTSAPIAVSGAAGHLDVLIVGSDYALYRQGFNGSAWGNWQRVGGLWSADPAATSPSAGAIYLAARDQSGAVWQTAVSAS